MFPRVPIVKLKFIIFSFAALWLLLYFLCMESNLFFNHSGKLAIHKSSTYYVAFIPFFFIRYAFGYWIFDILIFFLFDMNAFTVILIGVMSFDINEMNHNSWSRMKWNIDFFFESNPEIIFWRFIAIQSKIPVQGTQL